MTRNRFATVVWWAAWPEMAIQRRFRPFPFLFRSQFQNNQLLRQMIQKLRSILQTEWLFLVWVKWSSFLIQCPKHLVVETQTEPQMLSTFGLANTAALLSNGGLQHQVSCSYFDTLIKNVIRIQLKSNCYLNWVFLIHKTS